MRRALLVCQIVYPAIIRSAFGMFSCNELADGSSRLSAAPHLDCDSDESHVAKAIATASLVVWGAGFPLFLGLILYHKASDPRFSFVIVSYGYKPSACFWEALECLKKFGIMLTITFLQSTPELAATVLLILLCCTLVISAATEPFISSLINKAHIGCDLLIILFLVVGLLSSSAGRTSSQDAATVSIFVLGYLAFVLAALAVILVIEAGSILRPDSALHALWEKFVHTSPAIIIVSAARRASALLFSGVAPEPDVSTGPGVPGLLMVVEMPGNLKLAVETAPAHDCN